ncbi:hypothetical protein J4486_004415 [Salmonella enterica]|nr:hypothetical protein [Salmonella enterica]
MSTFEKLAIVICFMAIAAALMFYKLHHLLLRTVQNWVFRNLGGGKLMKLSS